MLPISAFIIAHNEADRIPHTLNSLRGWVEEIIVIDSGSTDDTVQVAESLGARVVFNPWKGYGPQKVFGETLCRNEWLLNLDADEEITPELRAEIVAHFAHPGTLPHAFAFRIMMFFRFEKKLPRIAAGTVQTRLYHRTQAGFRDSAVHDSVVLHSGGPVITLRAPVLHRSFRSHAHTVEKINRYSTMQAEDMFKKGRNPSALTLLFTPPVAFLKAYVQRRYMFYGVEGFIQSVIYAFARTLKMMKTREKFQEETWKRNNPPNP